MSDYEAGYDPKYGFNRNAFEHRPVHLKVIGGIVRNIAKPIGLVSESMAHTKDKKRTSENSASVGSLRDVQEKVEAPVPANPQTGLKDPEKGEVDMDEENWALDEAVPEVDDDLSNAVPQGDKQTEVAALMRSIQLPTSDKNTREKLPFPVVLPQRRPGTKARSFVRAYAPVLQDSGISQETFLGFLHSFYKASQASPIFDIIIIGCNLASAYPNPIVGAACFGVQVATAAAQEVQERWKTNKFLDSANKEIFMPRGLYALIVTYKSTDSNTLECETKTVDIGAQAVAKYGQHLLDDDDLADLKPEERDSKMKERMNRLRIASGETHGEKEMPLVCAPLVFPALEAIADSAEHGDENALDKIVAKSQSAGTFVADYFDRRAQATFVSFFFPPNKTYMYSEYVVDFRN